jgi:LPS export ABC transporter protein LptC
MALGVFTALCACNPQAPKTAAAPTPSPTASTLALPSLKIIGSGTARQPVRIVSQKGNRKQYQLIARSYVSNGAAGSAKASFTIPHVTFYARDGSTLVADAPRADIDQSANTVELTGGVRAHNSSGMTLQCDTLRYDRATEMIHGTGHVVITDRNGLHATGNRLDTDITLTHTQMQ